MPKSILYLSPYFWPEEIGSAPYSTELAVWLKQQGHGVRAVAFRPHYPSMDGFAAWRDGAHDEETYAGIGISRVPVSERGAGGFKERIKNDIRFLLAVWRKALTGRFDKTDVVIAYVPSILTVFGALVVKLTAGAKIVTIVHDIESGLAQSLNLVTSGWVLALMRRLEKFALNRSDHVIVLTEGMRNELEQMGCCRPISVISIWASLPPAAPIKSGEFSTLMYSGNFGKKQNLDQLIPLIRRLSAEKNSIKVIMQGDGSEKKRIEGLFVQAGISNAEFLPLVPAASLVSSLQAATVHLVPQALNVANYAVPSKIFSIMSVGRPYVCIAEEGSPLDELTKQSGAGICIAPHEDQLLFDAVVSLVQNEHELRVKGQNGRSYIDANMNKDKIMQQYYEVIVGE